MIRIFLVGIWICLVAFGSLFLATRTESPVTDKEPATVFGGLEYVKTDIISVPVFSRGSVSGYVVMQLVYTIDSDVRKKLTIPLEFFIEDEIFRKFYSSYSNSGPVENVKFEDVRGSIIEGINTRFPTPVVKDLLVEQFNYIPSNEIRAMNARSRPEAPKATVSE